MERYPMQMTFSQLELKELLKAWLAVSLVFAIAMVGLNTKLIVAIPIALLTGGISFLLHELAHKYVAQRARCWAEFRAHDSALVIGLLLSLLGVILLAPGGVYVHGANRSQHGRIALAGPLVNIILSVLFLFLATYTIGTIQLVAQYGFSINAFLAVFNLIPLPPFDGYSVFLWNKAAWAASMIGAGLLMIGLVV